ncbi:hypothetical protein CsSME_00008317 [Camellia sinensis var. sinensis]
MNRNPFVQVRRRAVWIVQWVDVVMEIKGGQNKCSSVSFRGSPLQCEEAPLRYRIEDVHPILQLCEETILILSQNTNGIFCRLGFSQFFPSAVLEKL